MFVTAGEGLGLHSRQQLLHLPVSEFRTFNARGGPYALDCGDALETGESLWGESLHRLPAALKLIDIHDELQDFGG